MKSGSDVASLKGKITGRHPYPVITSVVSTPPELIQAQQKVAPCVDAMFTDKMPFLTAIFKQICCRTAAWIDSKRVESCQKSLLGVLQCCRAAGFQVVAICADREFIPVLNPMKHEQEFEPNCTSAQECLPYCFSQH